MTAHDHRAFVEGCYRCELSRDEGGDGSPQLDLDAIERGHMMDDLDGGKHWVEMSAEQRSELVALVRRLQQENEELRFTFAALLRQHGPIAISDASLVAVDHCDEVVSWRDAPSLSTVYSYRGAKVDPE